VHILNESDARHFTVAELKEFGVGTQPAAFRGQACDIKFKARVAIEAVLSAESVLEVIAALRKVMPPTRQVEFYVSPVESVDLVGAVKSPVLAEVGVN